MNQIGKLFFTGISGTTLKKEEAQFIKNFSLGGVILFSKNYENRSQLQNLCNEIKKNSPSILIATDHEGGRVQRFRKGFTEFPPMMDVAKIGSPKLCFEVHEQMAKELTYCGVNVNLSPCADILVDQNCDVIGDRSFGLTKEVVSEFASSAVRGLQTNNVISCLKHFPGHGNTSVDSHEDLPVINDSLDVILDRDIYPFKRAVKSKSAFIMMAHLKIPAIDENRITTVSKKAYDLCRNSLKFHGVIITDDMEMGAIEKNYGRVEAAKMAIQAGATIVEYRSFERAYEVVTSLSDDKELLPLINKNEEIIGNVKNNFLNNKCLVEESVFSNGQKLNDDIQRSLSDI